MPVVVAGVAAGRAGPWGLVGLVGLLLLLPLVVGGMLWSAWRQDHERIASEFVREVAPIAANVRRGTDGCLHALYSVSHLYGSSEQVERGEFATFANRALAYLPGVEGLAWVAAVGPEGGGELVASARADGLADFRIRPLAAGGESAARGACVVLYAEPITLAPHVLGLDLASDRSVREAMERGRDRGEAAATAPLRLARVPGDEPWCMVLLPVFRNGVACTSVADRRAALAGYVAAFLRHGTMIEAYLRPRPPPGVRVRLLETGGPRGVDVCLWEQPGPAGATLLAEVDSRAAGLCWATPFSMAGRAWTLEFTPTERYLAERRAYALWVVGVACALFTVCIAVSLLLLARRAVRTEGLAAALSTTVARLREEIAERERVEAELRAGEARYRTLVENLPQRIFHKNTESVFITCNESFARNLGTMPAQIVGKTDYDFFPRDLADQYRLDDRRVVESGSVVDVEERHIEGGREIWVQTVKAPVRDGDGRVVGILGIYWDITARKQAEEEQLQLSGRLQETQRLESLVTLAGGIAHDFNNMLQVVIGNAELALAKVRPGVPTYTEVSEIRQVAMRASDLTRQMLDYTGRRMFEPRLVDLSEVVRHVVHAAAATAGPGLSVESSLAPDLPPTRGDPNQIEQAVVGLVTNAVEAIGEAPGRILLRTSCTDVDAAALARYYLGDRACAGPHAVIEVSDTGPGMDVVAKARLFEPFYSTKFVGRGLGLPAVLGTVRAHHGLVAVDTAPGQGTSVRLLFPVARDAVSAAVSTVAAPVGPRPPVHAAGPGATCTVLVVDDEAPVRQVAARFLQAAGYRVLAAVDGEDAVRVFAAESGSIDLILLDMTMPKLDGCQVLHEVRRLRPRVRVVLSSGYSEEDVTSRFGGAERPDGFLQKPYPRSALLERVASLLRSE